MYLFSIADSLMESFGRSFEMYESAIKEIPEEEWKKGEHHNLLPVVILQHSIEAVDFYSSDSSEFKWGYRFNLRWSDGDIADFPSKDDLLVYFKEVKEKLIRYIITFSDEDFLGEDPFGYHTGKGRLGRMLYLLSHLRQHMGELNAVLRKRNIPRIKWR